MGCSSATHLGAPQNLPTYRPARVPVAQNPVRHVSFHRRLKKFTLSPPVGQIKGLGMWARKGRAWGIHEQNDWCGVIAVSNTYLVDRSKDRTSVRLRRAEQSLFLADFRLGWEIAKCCDADLYLLGSEKFFAEGLFFDNGYSGYRSYLNYGVTGVLRLIGGVAGATQADSFVFGALFVFAATAVGLVLTLSHRKGFTSIFAAIFLNPITLAYVPYPLQENQMVILMGGGIVAIWVALKERCDRLAVAALLVFAALAWMVKGSFSAISIPVAGLAVVMAVQTKGSRLAVLGGAFLALIIIAPQSYVAWHKFGTLYPHPDWTVMAKQIVWGHSAWRYETSTEDGNWRGVFRPAPFPVIETPDEYITRLKTAPLEIAALWVGHVVGAFDHSQLKVYIVEARSSLFSPFNVLVGAVLFLGLARWAGVLRGGNYRRSDFFLDSIMLGGAAALPLLAVETRF